MSLLIYIIELDFFDKTCELYINPDFPGFNSQKRTNCEEAVETNKNWL